MKLCLALLLAAAASDAPLFEDQFDGKLADGWSWVREDKGDWSVKVGALRIRATPGNLWEAENTARNLLLRSAPQGRKSFAAEVTVTHAPVTFAEPEGGFSIWAHTDVAIDELEFLRCALDAGVMVDPGSLFQVTPRAQIAMRLAFSNTPVDRLAEAARRLGRAIDRARTR